MDNPKNFQTIAGVLDYVTVVNFAKLLIKNNPKTVDAVTDNIMERIVLGIPTKESKRIHYIRREIMDNDVTFAAYEPGINDMFAESSEYKTFKFQFDPVFDEDIVDVVIKQLLRVFETYQPSAPNGTKYTDINDVIEDLALHCLENYITPTHLIQLKPNIMTAISIHDFEIAYREIDGIINISVFTDKPKGLRALEAPNMY